MSSLLNLNSFTITRKLEKFLFYKPSQKPPVIPMASPSRSPRPNLAPILVVEPKGVLEAPPPLRPPAATARGGTQPGAPGEAIDFFLRGKSHPKSWKIMENYGKWWKMMDDVGWCVMIHWVWRIFWRGFRKWGKMNQHLLSKSFKEYWWAWSIQETRDESSTSAEPLRTHWVHSKRY